MNFKFITKSSLIEKILFGLILILIIIFVNKLDLVKRENFIDKSEKFIKYYGNDIYDNFYVSIYDQLMQDDVKNTYEVGEIINKKVPTNIIKVLDIGCGTGHHVNLLNNNNINCIGIDISQEMINKAKQNYPQLNFKLANALDNMLFQDNEFTHISCLNYTIYCIKDKEQFLENCFKWLIPGGILILHLVDIYNFNSVLPSADVVELLSLQLKNDNRLTQSNIHFKDFDYKSNFDINCDNCSEKKLNKPNAFFREKFIFNNDNVRINEHQYYMNSQTAIMSIAKDVGFIQQGYAEMDNVNYKNNYLYWLYKPE